MSIFNRYSKLKKEHLDITTKYIELIEQKNKIEEEFQKMKPLITESILIAFCRIYGKRITETDCPENCTPEYFENAILFEKPLKLEHHNPILGICYNPDYDINTPMDKKLLLNGKHMGLEAIMSTSYAAGDEAEYQNWDKIGYTIIEILTEQFKIKGITDLMNINNLQYVDLGLPSGKLWATENVKDENSNEAYYTFDDAVNTFGKSLPSKEDWNELFDNSTCNWNEERKGYDVTGPNGNSIFLPAAGYRSGAGVSDVGFHGYYWSSSPYDENYAYGVHFGSGFLDLQFGNGRYGGFSVRLVR